VLLSNEKTGNGLVLHGNKQNIAWRQIEDEMRLSHNLLVAGLGTKFKMPKTSWRARDVGQQQGAFILIPVSKNDKPDMVKNVFGRK
jgi:hypothetical protein